MKYVIIRDDDANATTPPNQLEQLYRPFLDRGMPVHLAVVPEVRADILGPDGELEGFIQGPNAGKPANLPVEENTALLDYLRHEPGFRVLQHGLRHEFVGGHYEFQRDDAEDLRSRIELGKERLREAGFAEPTTFVAPQDKLSRVAMREVLKRFPVISTGWYDLDKVPRRLWAPYLLSKKVRHASHFRTGRHTFFTHPGCILSHRRDPATILPRLRAEVASRDITVIVSHHWEYFLGGRPNVPYMNALSGLCEWLASDKNIRVITFDQAVEHVR